MAELKGIKLATHLDSIVDEFEATESIYGFPRRKMYMGFDGLDLGVDFHGQRAETLLGPAAGPHTQMAQNIILAFLGGSRIMELKTVQILDQLEIPRPCIDIRNIGYNVEWSQELRLQESLDEYVTAWVLLKLIEELELLGVPKGNPFYNTIFDISVGYDLKGIRSPQMNDWLTKIKNAGPAIDERLQSLPARFKHLKRTAIPPQISNSITLSTFHGCPADEIEAMVEHLIGKHGFHVIVKMNPTILGYKRVQETLIERLGYHSVELDPAAFEHDISFAEATEMMKRLQQFARRHKVNLGAKFTNTLVVKNNQPIFSDEVMYLSGAPLHVLAMTALHEFRLEMGASFPISFSAGITKHNFVDAVICNLRPVSTCTDLLKEGGYTRLFDYLRRLQTAMKTAGRHDIESFIRSQAGVADLAVAGIKNANRIVPALADNKIYHQSSNENTPPKIDSRLELFDCITCNKCIPVCPNAANFAIPTHKTDVAMTHFTVENGQLKPDNGERFVIEKESQIANLADFCNECGDCDTYCPEHGGPFIEKPRFFSSIETFQQFEDHDGFFLKSRNSMIGRINGSHFELDFDEGSSEFNWSSSAFQLRFDLHNNLLGSTLAAEKSALTRIDVRPYLIMRTLLEGIRESRAYPKSVLLPKS